MIGLKKTALILFGFLTVSCSDSGPPARSDTVGRWVSTEGFEVNLSLNTYEFCDGGECFIGEVLREGASNSIAVELKDIFVNPISSRFEGRLEELRERDQGGKDLFFTITGGSVRKDWCGGKFCVLFGSVEDDEHLIFFKVPVS